jgi:hypothetical protein
MRNNGEGCGVLISNRKVLQVKIDPKKESYMKGEVITFEVEPLEKAGFYVWRIDGYGQRAIETKTPQLALTFKETSDLSKGPVEVGLAGAPSRINFKISVSAYDNHFYYTLLGEGKSELSVICN